MAEADQPSLLDELIGKIGGLAADDRAQLVAAVGPLAAKMRWAPNPGPQTEAYFCEADELFYGGQAGGGKSDLGVGLALNEHERSLLLREFNEDARSLGERLIAVIGSSNGWNGQLLRYKGEGQLIEFGGCQHEEDKQRYKGDPHDLIVFDELPDFTETQYTFISAWNRSATGHRCRIVATGNPPTRAKGMWVIRRWAAWLDPKHPNPAKPGELRWYTTDEDGNEIEVEGRGPHLIGGEMVEARSRTFIRAKLSDNPDLLASGYDKVLANLPGELRAAYRDGRFDAGLKDDPWQLIPTAWVMEAFNRWVDTPPRDVPMCAIAADVAQGGEDNNVIQPRHDGWFPRPVVVPGKLTPLGTDVSGIIVANRRDQALVIIDCGGGYGGAVFTHLKENQIPAIAYKGAEKSTRRSQDQQLGFVNKRTEVLWRFREALDPSQPGGSPIALYYDPELLADLTSVSYEMTARGIKAENKEDVCDRLGRSTDKGDAVVICWSAGPKAVTDGRDWENNRIGRPGGRVPQVIMGKGPRLTAGRRR